MKIAINGFGRIGESVLKIALERKMNIVAINDIHGTKDAEYVLKNDSIYGKFKGKVSAKGNCLFVNGKKILVLSEKNPLNLPWKKMKIDVVVESTGVFTKRRDALKHLKSGAKKVVVTAPLKDKPDVTIVPGVNSKKLKKNHKLISVASCTTNCSASVLKVLNENFGIKRAMLSTIHAYTSSQSLVDSSDEKNPRRGRSALANIIPASTGASEAISEVLPELKGKIKAMAMRVPVSDGSIIDLTAELKKPFTVSEINSAFKKSAKKEMKGILEYSEENLVSSDIIGNSHSAIFDSKLTEVQGNLVKVLAWYDNEYGYSSRVVDVLKMLGKM